MPAGPDGKDSVAVALEIFGGPVAADGQPLVNAPAPTRQQVVEKLCMTLKTLGWQALTGVGSYPIGGDKGRWYDFITTAPRPQLDRALDAAARALADLNGHTEREPGEEG